MLEDPLPLSQALAHYPPIAGRLAVAATSGDGELHIACTGEGVSFVGVSISCALDDEKVTRPTLLLSDLAVGYPADYCCLSDPLLLMQVTEFSCGVTWNHVIADAAGMAQFLQAVGELARGVPEPAVVPVRCEVQGSLPCLPPPLVAAMRSHMRVETEELATLDVTIPTSLINRIKFECGCDCTVFEAVAALLWRCRTRAVMSDGDPDASVPLAFPSNVRDLVGAREGYYGNCMTLQQVQASSGTVASSEIKDLVRLTKLAKEKASDIFQNGGSTSGGGDQQRLAPPRYNALGVSSWRNLGFEAVDFGRGRPARVMWKAHPTVGLVCVPCPPCKGEDGISVVSRCVEPEHADAFLAELAALDV